MLATNEMPQNEIMEIVFLVYFDSISASAEETILSVFH